MNIPTWRCFCLALYSLLSAVPVFAEDAAPIRSFADSLYAEEDYYRAITEYKRLLHLHPADPDADSARLAIGLSYFRGEKWDAAIDAFRNIEPGDDDPFWSRRAQLLLGESSYRKGDVPDALDAFGSYARSSADDFTPDARMRAAQCLILLGKKPPALVSEGSASGADRLGAFSRRMEEVPRIPRKSPALAGALSAILPGAGQLYVRRPRDAGISFLLNGSLIALAIIAFENDEPVAGGLISAVEVSWYAGNVYGAVNGAHKFNRSERRRFIDRLDVECGIMRGADTLPVPGGRIGVQF